MADAEVHALWAQLYPWDGQWADRARKQIDAARAAAPGSPEVRFWTGLFNLEQGKLDESASELCAAQAMRPTERRYQLALTRLFGEQERRSPSPAGKPRGCPR